MKKAYETPSVEMIAFRYRDQVVATSGVSANSSNTNASEYTGGNVCGLVDYYVEGKIDFRLCNINV